MNDMLFVNLRKHTSRFSMQRKM